MQIKAASSLWTICCWMLAKVIWMASHSSLGVERAVWELKIYDLTEWSWVKFLLLAGSSIIIILTRKALKEREKIHISHLQVIFLSLVVRSACQGNVMFSLTSFVLVALLSQSLFNIGNLKHKLLWLLYIFKRYFTLFSAD